MENGKESCCDETKSDCCKQDTHWSPENCCTDIMEVQAKIMAFLPNTRERSILITHLDNALMWAKGAFNNGN